MKLDLKIITQSDPENKTIKSYIKIFKDPHLIITEENTKIKYKISHQKYEKSKFNEIKISHPKIKILIFNSETERNFYFDFLNENSNFNNFDEFSLILKNKLSKLSELILIDKLLKSDFLVKNRKFINFDVLMRLLEFKDFYLSGRVLSLQKNKNLENIENNFKENINLESSNIENIENKKVIKNVTLSFRPVYKKNNSLDYKENNKENKVDNLVNIEIFPLQQKIFQKKINKKSKKIFTQILKKITKKSLKKFLLKNKKKIIKIQNLYLNYDNKFKNIHLNFIKKNLIFFSENNYFLTNKIFKKYFYLFLNLNEFSFLFFKNENLKIGIKYFIFYGCDEEKIIFFYNLKKFLGRKETFNFLFGSDESDIENKNESIKNEKNDIKNENNSDNENDTINIKNKKNENNDIFLINSIFSKNIQKIDNELFQFLLFISKIKSKKINNFFTNSNLLKIILQNFNFFDNLKKTLILRILVNLSNNFYDFLVENQNLIFQILKFNLIENERSENMIYSLIFLFIFKMSPLFDSVLD